MENFNFKVGDKVRHKNWGKYLYVTITAIGKESFLVETSKGLEVIYQKTHEWQPYEEPKPKPKLKKFYCSDKEEDCYFVKYYSCKEKSFWIYTYTEAEFLEKFDVEL